MFVYFFLGFMSFYLYFVALNHFYGVYVDSNAILLFLYFVHDCCLIYAIPESYFFNFCSFFGLESFYSFISVNDVVGGIQSTTATTGVKVPSNFVKDVLRSFEPEDAGFADPHLVIKPTVKYVLLLAVLLVFDSGIDVGDLDD